MVGAHISPSEKDFLLMVKAMMVFNAGKES
jgi:hypothetical protein